MRGSLGKKALAVIVAAAMMLSIAAPAAFAGQEGKLTGGSITIDNATVGQTYSVYQILYLEGYNATSNAYSYKANSAWESWLEGQTAYVSIDEQGYVTWVEGASAADFAKAAQAYAKESGITSDPAAVTATSTTVSFTDLKLGYYLVDSTLGTLCSLNTTNPNVTVKEKNAVPTNGKTVEEDSNSNYGSSNDADLGQTVNFKSTIIAQAGAENYVFHDTMSAGLTYTGVTGVTLNGAPVNASNYTVAVKGSTVAPTDDCTFEVRFTQGFCDTLKANDQIVISYSATLNENAVVGGGGNSNESKLSYGDEGKTTTAPSETKTYTWDFDVFKFAMDGKNEKALSGATFTLSKNADGSDPIALVSEGSNVYRVAMTGDTNTITEITTDATGTFTIKGLDSDTYYLTETQNPAGYNKLSDPVIVVIGENGSVSVDGKVVSEVKVENKSGSELPSTGGMGVAVLYIAGGMLIVAAALGLVIMRRNASRK